MSVGDRLRLLREKLRMSQEEFAPLLGLKQGPYSRRETDRRDPKPGELRLAADLTDSPGPVYRWLREGGEMPAFHSIPSSAASGRGEAVSGATPPENTAAGRMYRDLLQLKQDGMSVVDMTYVLSRFRKMLEEERSEDELRRDREHATHRKPSEAMPSAGDGEPTLPRVSGEY